MRTYDSYKDSGIEWIGEIPNHWFLEKGRRLIPLKNGFPFDSSKFSPLSISGYPLVRIRDIETSISETFYSGEPVQDAFINNGDILIGMDGDFNIAIWKGGIALLNQRVCKLEQNEKFYSKFLFYLLPKYLKVINDLTYFTTVKHLSNNDIWELKYPLPPIEEQFAIASYLDRKTAEIDELIADKKRLLQLYEEEKTAVINQAITKGIDPDAPMKDSGIEWLGEIPEHWEVKKLKQLLKSVTGGGTPSTSNPLFWDGDIPWVSAKDMKSDFIYSSEDYITRLAVEKSSTNYFENERVIIVVRSGILKHTFPVAINKVPVCINQDLKGIEPIERLSNEFLFWKLKGQAQNILTFCSKMGATVDSLDMQYLMDFPFGYPPNIDEQKEIVSFIEKQKALIDDKVSKTRKLIDLLTEYRIALISEVVTGKVKVID